MKLYVFTFSHIWPCSKICQWQSKVLIRISWYSTWVPYATYQISRPSVNWFWRRFLKFFFTLYGRGGHTGHSTWTVWTLFCLHQPWRLLVKYDYNWRNGFWDVWNCQICQIMVSPASKVKWGMSCIKSQMMTLTSSTHKSLCTYWDKSNYHFMPKSSKLSTKSYVLAFSHIWPCHKKVKVNQRSSFE